MTAKELEAKTKRAIQGDRAALEELIASKRRSLYFTALTMLSSKEDAEDAVQDTMLSIFKNIGNLKNPKAFNAWAYKILHISCAGILRKRERQVSSVLLSEVMIDTVADEDRGVEPERMLGEKEMCGELYEAIRALPEKSRETLLLYYFGDMKYKEIAMATGSSIKTVSTNLIRAKKNLAVFMREHYPEAAPLAALLPALKATALAQAAGGATLAGAKLGSAALLKGHILAAAANAAVPAGAGLAAAACVGVLTYSALAPPHYEIALSGDHEYGNVNPRHIEMAGVRRGDSLGEWEVLARDGSVLHTGALDSATDYIRNLEAAQSAGYYTLRCIVTDKDGNRYAVSREIIIGDFPQNA